MKLILENWNKFLNEAAMGMDDLPPDTVVVINERKNSETEIYYSSLYFLYSRYLFLLTRNDFKTK